MFSPAPRSFCDRHYHRLWRGKRALRRTRLAKAWLRRKTRHASKRTRRSKRHHSARRRPLRRNHPRSRPAKSPRSASRCNRTRRSISRHLPRLAGSLFFQRRSSRFVRPAFIFGLRPFAIHNDKASPHGLEPPALSASFAVAARSIRVRLFLFCTHVRRGDSRKRSRGVLRARRKLHRGPRAQQYFRHAIPPGKERRSRRAPPAEF